MVNYTASIALTVQGTLALSNKTTSKKLLIKTDVPFCIAIYLNIAYSILFETNLIASLLLRAPSS